MGNLLSLDMGLVMLRCTVFDKSGKLKKLLEEAQTEIGEKSPASLGDTLSFDGFTETLSIYSPLHQGTFYFLQYNILRTTDVSLAQ